MSFGSSLVIMSGQSLSSLTGYPWSEMALGVRSALRSPYFQPASADRNALIQEVRDSNSITARCLKCGPETLDKKKEVKVSLKSTSNLITHLKTRHGPVESEASKRWLESNREEFVTRHPRRSNETRVVRPKNARSLQKRFETALLNLVAKTTIPLRSWCSTSGGSARNT